jgi:hypothetical protein
MRTVGFFSDLPHGREDEPHLLAVAGRLDPDLRKTVADYLRKGTLLRFLTAVCVDYLDPRHVNIGPLYTMTDGDLVWPSDLPYYVEFYGAILPDEALSAILFREVPPAVSEADLAEMLRRFETRE